MKKYLLTLAACIVAYVMVTFLLPDHTSPVPPDYEYSGKKGLVSMAYAHPLPEEDTAAATVEAAVASTETPPIITEREVTIKRESFSYSSPRRRDPFVSLLASDELSPQISEVRLTTIAFDSEGGRSVAVLRNVEDGKQYRVMTGDRLGRARVLRIYPRSVTFTVNEFGYSRTETLSLSDGQVRGMR